MKLSDAVRGQWQRIGTLAWDPQLCNPRWIDIEKRDIPPYAGVYVWMDGGSIQKVGKTESSEGLRGRLSFGRGDPMKDSTTRLWRDQWGEGPLLGRTIEVYFSPHQPVFSSIPVPGLGLVECLNHVARSIEKQLSARARREGEPMLLAGKAD